MGELLDRILQADNLRSAWLEVTANQGMAGVDDLSVRRWERGWEERLVELAVGVRANTYRPARLKVVRIPKEQPNEWRVLRIPTVTDRVLQRAVYQVLCPRYERLFLPCSFGYRPGRGLQDAVRRIIDLRDRGMRWVLDADIDAYFDSVDHTLLLRLLEDNVGDPLVLALIKSWLAKGRIGGQALGIAMGSPLSPLLANIYLHPLDRQLSAARYNLVRYADDFVVLTETRSAAETAQDMTRQCLAALKLTLNPDKTCIRSFEEGFLFLGVRFEENEYSYTWDDKRITIEQGQSDWLFKNYGPHYS